MALWTQYGGRLCDQELKVLHSGSLFIFVHDSNFQDSFITEIHFLKIISSLQY